MAPAAPSSTVSRLGTLGPGDTVVTGVTIPPYPSADASRLPAYLHAVSFGDSHLAYAGAWYATHHVSPGDCTVVRDSSGLIGRNMDWLYDEASTWAVSVTPGPSRFPTVGFANLGAAVLPESVAVSGVKGLEDMYALPGMTSDGVNAEGLFAAILVIPRKAGADPAQSASRTVHPLSLVRRVIDGFDDAAEAAEWAASAYYIPEGSPQSYHWVIADRSGNAYVVEDGRSAAIPAGAFAVTNFRVLNPATHVWDPDAGLDGDVYGTGIARRNAALMNLPYGAAAALSSARYSAAYWGDNASPASWSRLDEFAGSSDASSGGPIENTDTERLRTWAENHVKPLLTGAGSSRRPAARGTGCWQTVHSALYNLAAGSVSVRVQELLGGFVSEPAVFSAAAGGSASLPAPVAPSTDIPSYGSYADAKRTAEFVNSSINAMAAFYITKNAAGDPFATKAELTAAAVFYNGGQPRVPTKNDYLFILADESHPTAAGTAPTTRYSFDGAQWAYQITVNDTALTAAQLAALNSGVDSTKVGRIPDGYDEQPVQNSRNVVRSGGVWTWVKGLLPSWLTPSREEPPTQASVAAKQDANELSVVRLTAEGPKFGLPDEIELGVAGGSSSSVITLTWDPSASKWINPPYKLSFQYPSAVDPSKYAATLQFSDSPLDVRSVVFSKAEAGGYLYIDISGSDHRYIKIPKSTIALTSDIPAVVAPSASAADQGKAADAKATGDALAAKRDKTDLGIVVPSDFAIKVTNGTPDKDLRTIKYWKVVKDGSEKIFTLSSFSTATSGRWENGTENIFLTPSSQTRLYLNGFAFGSGISVYLSPDADGYIRGFDDIVSEQFGSVVHLTALTDTLALLSEVPTTAADVGAVATMAATSTPSVAIRQGVAGGSGTMPGNAPYIFFGNAGTSGYTYAGFINYGAESTMLAIGKLDSSGNVVVEKVYRLPGSGLSRPGDGTLALKDDIIPAYYTYLNPTSPKTAADNSRITFGASGLGASITGLVIQLNGSNGEILFDGFGSRLKFAVELPTKAVVSWLTVDEAYGYHSRLVSTQCPFGGADGIDGSVYSAFKLSWKKLSLSTYELRFLAIER